MYTINQKHVPMRVAYGSRKYLVGFSNLTFARKVLYSLHPDMSRIRLLPNDPRIVRSEPLETTICIDAVATIFLPKHEHPGGHMHPLNDASNHLATVSEHVFFNAMYKPLSGIVVPYVLVDEDENEFVFTCHVISGYSMK